MNLLRFPIWGVFQGPFSPDARELAGIMSYAYLLLMQLCDPQSSTNNARAVKCREINVKDIDELMKSLESWYTWPSGTYTKRTVECDRHLKRILTDLQIIDSLRHKRDNPSWTMKDHDGIAELSRMIATAARNARISRTAGSDAIVISLAQVLGL